MYYNKNKKSAHIRTVLTITGREQSGTKRVEREVIV
jgi:hypothetical protein